jgi:RND family efflux transporter MFP subunit
MFSTRRLDETPPARRKWMIPGIISGVVILAVGCGSLLLQRAQSSVNQVAMNATPKRVEVARARAAMFRPTRRYVGTLEPWLSAHVGPQLASGFVDTVLVRPGAVVKRGDVLATIDCRNASAASRAVSHQARALEQRQKAAAREAGRLGELLDGGYASPNEVDQKQAQSAAEEAQIQALLAQAAGRSLEVGDCVLRAPFDGEVAARMADPGAFVRPGATIVDVVDRAVLRLTADVPEVDFEAVPPKTPARIRLLANGRELTGEISRRAPAADPATRTIHVEMDLPNAARDIPVGTTAEISIEVGQPTPAVEIPLLAAKVRGKTATVFLVDVDTAKKATLSVLGERGDSLFAKGGIGEGAWVVTQGRSLLQNGDRVLAKADGPLGSTASVAPAGVKHEAQQ